MTARSIADLLRAAALGQTPNPSKLRMDWVGINCVLRTGKALGALWGLDGWASASVVEKRMFLLMVAEAVDDDGAARSM